MNKKARIIAFYLPQFHPIPENDEWWGKGFTEWTNVGKAKPLFRNHYQPRVPADLGYYDLRLSEVREAQAELALEAGVEGFCYWHYWFGNGKRLLERPFNEVLTSGKPNFPFCLGWANHSWEAKNWNSEDTDKNIILIEQTYPGEADIVAHFNEVLPALKDKRYICVDGKPLFYIYAPDDLPNNFIGIWTKLAKENGLKGIYFIGQITRKADERAKREELISMGFNSVSIEPQRRIYATKSYTGKLLYRIKTFIRYLMLGLPINKFRALIVDYKSSIPLFTRPEFDILENVIPCLLPDFDHSPRSGAGHTFLFHNSTPELFKEHARRVFEVVSQKENKIVFLKSWNEWAEGNYIEPDLKWGKQYITALREALDE